MAVAAAGEKSRNGSQAAGAFQRADRAAEKRGGARARARRAGGPHHSHSHLRMRAAGDRQTHGFGNWAPPGGVWIEYRRVGTSRKKPAPRAVALIGVALAIVAAPFRAPSVVRRRSMAVPLKLSI